MSSDEKDAAQAGSATTDGSSTPSTETSSPQTSSTQVPASEAASSDTPSSETRQLSDAMTAPVDGHGADIEPDGPIALAPTDPDLHAPTPTDPTPTDPASADPGSTAPAPNDAVAADTGAPRPKTDSGEDPPAGSGADPSRDRRSGGRRPAEDQPQHADAKADRPIDDDSANLWEPAGSFDDDAPYVEVRRSSPGWAIAKWVLSGLVTTAVIILSFIMIPRLFTPESSEPEPASAGSGGPASTTAPATSVAPPVATYPEVVLASAPTHYWKFEMQAAGSDSVGPAALEIGGDTPVLGSSAYAGGQGSIDCSGTQNSRALTSAAETPAGDFSIEAWINTVTNDGGPIVTFGNKPTGTSWKLDRVLYMGTNGKVYFGTQTKKGREFTVSKLPLNTGTWRHIVGTMSTTAGLSLYVDGQPVNSEKDGTSAGDFEGYWKICGDNTSGWPGNSGRPAFTGTVDDVSIYPKMLSAQEVLDHYEAAMGL